MIAIFLKVSDFLIIYCNNLMKRLLRFSLSGKIYSTFNIFLCEEKEVHPKNIKMICY